MLRVFDLSFTIRVWFFLNDPFLGRKHRNKRQSQECYMRREKQIQNESKQHVLELQSLKSGERESEGVWTKKRKIDVQATETVTESDMFDMFVEISYNLLLFIEKLFATLCREELKG